MYRAPSHSGFTLVEAMITVVVVAVLLAVAAPAFQGSLDKRRLVGAAEQLYADLQYARSEAIKHNASVYVSFATGANWCYGIALAECDCNAATCQLDGVQKVVSASNFRGVSLTETFSRMGPQFESSRGTANNGTATLSSDYGSINVIVSQLGRVRICSGSANLSQYKPSSGTTC